MATLWYYLRWLRLIVALMVGALGVAFFIINSMALLVDMVLGVRAEGVIPFFESVVDTGTAVGFAAILWYGPVVLHKLKYRILGAMLGNIRSFKFEGMARACYVTGRHNYDSNADDNIKMCTRCGHTKWKGDNR